MAEITPWIFTTSINETKEPLCNDPEMEKAYPAFVVNRNMSLFSDTALYANEVNKYPDLPNKLKFEFLRLAISKKRRFSKWPKSPKIEDLELIQEVYGFSRQKALQALKLLTPENINIIKASRNTGGVSKTGV